MITFFIQLLYPIAVIFYKFKKRDHFFLRLFGFGALFCGLSALFYAPDAIPFIPVKIGYFLYYLTGYVFAFLYVWSCFKMPLINMLYFVVQAFLLHNFSHHIFQLGMRLAGVPVGEEYSKILYLVILGAVYTVIYTLSYFLFIRNIKMQELNEVPKVSFLIAIFFFVVMIILGAYVRHINTYIFAEPSVAIIYELYSIILVFFIICMQFGVFNIGKLQESKEELEQRISHEGKYYEIAHANVDEIRMLCHDLKHQIAALKHMTSGDEKQSIISELENSVSVYENIVKTGNEALDYVLTEKGLYCNNNKINFTVIADGKLLSHVKYKDIYILFGNALDNAIESVLKIDNISKRLISLKIQNRGGMALIHLENLYVQQPKFINGLPITTKFGKGHGYGVRSMRYIVEKYGGNLTSGAENGIFSLDILLPIPTALEKDA